MRPRVDKNFEEWDLKIVGPSTTLSKRSPPVTALLTKISGSSPMPDMVTFCFLANYDILTAKNLMLVNISPTHFLQLLFKQTNPLFTFDNNILSFLYLSSMIRTFLRMHNFGNNFPQNQFGFLEHCC